MAPSLIQDHTSTISGPTFEIGMAPLDARHPVHYSPRLLIFRCDDPEHHSAQLAALKHGLQALISTSPILGGQVVLSQNTGSESLRKIIPGDGIELVVKDLRASMPSFAKLSAANFSQLELPDSLLMPVSPDEDNTERGPACKVQFSAIERGTIVTFTISHSLADGSGTNELMRILSEETRLAQTGLVNRGPMDTIGHDRSILRNITSETAFAVKDHPAFRDEPFPSKTSTALEVTHVQCLEATAPEIPVLLRISAADLARLKADATTPDAPFISTHDALSALVWRTTILIRSRRSDKAKKLPPSTKTSFYMPSDARRHLGLPASYVGNAVYQVAVTSDLRTLLSPSGLQEAASAIRKAIKAVTPDLVASYMTELKSRWIDWQFMNGTLSTTGVAMGTDWSSGELYGHQWADAFGPVIAYRYPYVAGEAGNVILPKLPDGSAELEVAVMPDEVAILRGPDGFGKYLQDETV